MTTNTLSPQARAILAAIATLQATGINAALQVDGGYRLTVDRTGSARYSQQNRSPAIEQLCMLHDIRCLDTCSTTLDWTPEQRRAVYRRAMCKVKTSNATPYDRQRELHPERYP